MKSDREEVYAAIDGERAYQEQHTPRDPKNPGFTPGDYATMMSYYSNVKLPEAFCLNAGDDQVLHNMRKIAAIAVQCLEVHGALTRDEEGLGPWGKEALRIQRDEIERAGE